MPELSYALRCNRCRGTGVLARSGAPCIFCKGTGKTVFTEYTSAYRVGGKPPSSQTGKTP